MGGPSASHEIETVRGRLSDELRDEIVRFWTAQGALDEQAGRQRLPEVICVLRDPSGAIAGVNSVYAEDVGLIGGRRFWVYRSFLPGEAEDARDAMRAAAFDALAEEFNRAEDEPIGLCLIVNDREEIESHREALWPDTELMYAGYTADGRQVRLRYFDGARIGPGADANESESELDEGYRIELFDEQDAVSEEDVLALWSREGVVPPAEAERRISEVFLVGIHGESELAGISSAYLQRNPQLQLELWYYRAFVGSDHRQSNIAVNLAVIGRDLLSERFASGEDTRGPGALYEVENPGLKSYFNLALWLPTRFTFIGENPRGDHCRVHWFPGAQAPLPG